MDLAKELVSFDGVTDQWRLILAVIFLVFLLVERIGSLRSAWINYRLGRDELSLEKQRLEIEKLKYEIAAIKKTHGLPELVPPAEPAAARTVTLTRERETPTQSPPWDWQVEYPLAATMLARLGQGLLAFFGFVWGISGLVTPFLPLIDNSMSKSEWPYMLVGAILNLFLAYGCYRGYRRLQRSVQAIRSPKQNMASAVQK